jgi:hypothetical protein
MSDGQPSSWGFDGIDPRRTGRAGWVVGSSVRDARRGRVGESASCASDEARTLVPAILLDGARALLTRRPHPRFSTQVYAMFG